MLDCGSEFMGSSPIILLFIYFLFIRRKKRNFLIKDYTIKIELYI